MNDFPNPETNLWDRVMWRYPAPIAAAARNVRAAGTKKEEHDAILDLIEISTMTLATYFASQFIADGGKSENITQYFSKMAKPDFGDWVNFLETIQSYFSKTEHHSIGRSLAMHLKNEIPAPARTNAINAIQTLREHKEKTKSKQTPLDFLNPMSTYRNLVSHVPPPRPNEEVCRVRLEWLLPAVEEWLESIAFIQDYPLVYVQRIDSNLGGLTALTLNGMGWDTTNRQRERPATTNVRSGQMYLCSALDGAPSLALLPTLVMGKCSGCNFQPRVLILQKANTIDKNRVPSTVKSLKYSCLVSSHELTFDKGNILLDVLGMLRYGLDSIAPQERGDNQTVSPPMESRGPTPANDAQSGHPIERDQTETPIAVPLSKELPILPVPVVTSPESESSDRGFPDESTLRRMINPNVSLFLTLYSQSQASNQRTRGLDEFGERTYVPTRLDTELKPQILSGDLKLVILTGNAGDGKTAFIQQVEAEAKTLGVTDFEDTQYGSRFKFKNRLYQTIYDGSEDEGNKDNAQRLDEFFADFRGAVPPRAQVTKIIAINEGHLRKVVLHNEKYEWLGKQVHHFLEYENYRLDPSLLIINLNLRSIVDLDLDSGTSLFDHVLNRYLAPEFWAECQRCTAAMRCPIKFNVDTLADPDFGSQVRHRLKSIFLTTHFRRKQHITVRDLRSGLAYILFNRDDCEQIHTHLEADDAKFEDHFYYNAAFGSYPVGEEETSASPDKEDRLIRLLREIDVAPIANPRLDNLLNFNPPSAIGLFADFNNRAGADFPELEGLYAKTHAAGAMESDFYFKQVNRYHGALRRKYFFESMESAASEAGYPRWDALLPLRSLREFDAAFRDPQMVDAIRDQIVDAINLSERIYNPAVTSHYVCVRTNASQSSLVKAFNQFPKDEFKCVVRDIGAQAIFLEHCPNILHFVYQPDKSRSLEISLDLFELLRKMRHGYAPSGSELKGFFLNLLMFKKQLTALSAQAIVLTEDEERFYRLEKTGARTLAIHEVQ